GGAADDVGDVVVASGQAVARVDGEEDEGGVGDGRPDLGNDERGVDVLLIGLEAARVDEAEANVLPLGVGLDAVAGRARLVVGARPAAAEKAVEERGLAHVGPADDDDAREGGRGGRAHGSAVAGIRFTSSGSAESSRMPAGGVTFTW